MFAANSLLFLYLNSEVLPCYFAFRKDNIYLSISGTRTHIKNQPAK